MQRLYQQKLQVKQLVDACTKDFKEHAKQYVELGLPTNKQGQPLKADDELRLFVSHKA